MSKQTWKPPVFLDINSLDNPDHDEWSTVTKTEHPVAKPKSRDIDYQKPVVLDLAETTLEPAATAPFQPTPVHPMEVVESGDEVTIPDARPGSTPGWIWPLLAASIVAAVVLEVVFFLGEEFARSITLGTAYLVLLGAIFTAVGYAVRHYYLEIRQLANIDALRERGEALFKQNQFGQSHFYTGELTALYQARQDMIPRLEKFVAGNSDAHSDRDVLLLFSDTVMKPLDKKANEITVKRSKETALMVVLSPFAFLDVILTLWRNIRLIRDIASLYGGRPGFLSSLGLIKKVLQSLAYAEVAELVVDSAAETLGGSIVSSLSVHLAKGIGSGVMTARVGIHAMKICRPLPYVHNDKPSLKGIRKEILKSVKVVFDRAPKDKFTERRA